MDQNQMYDMQTIEVMKRVLSENSNCIDIGCHQGIFLDEIIGISPKGFHYGFEALPDLSAKLMHKFKDKLNIEIHNLALSDISGEVAFEHVISNPGYSGLKQRKYDRPNEQIQKIKVNAAKLDDVISNLFDIAFIKIDVEGAELQVLKGAIQTIKRCKPVVVFEHGLGAADCYGTEPEMIFNFFDDCGLMIYVMERWLKSTKDKLNKEDFIRQFKSAENYYFMAAPLG